MKERSRYWLVAGFLALAFDRLFWNVDHGINFPLFAVLCVAGGFLVLAKEGHRPAPTVFLLGLPLVFFAWGSFWRLEPLAHVLSCAWVLLFMGLLAVYYRKSEWWRTDVWQTLWSFLKLLTTAVAHGFIYRSPNPSPGQGEPKPKPGWVAPVVRGLLVALPVTGLFALLLARADAVFARYLASWFSFRALAEAVFRLSYMLFGAYLLVGVFTFVAREAEKEPAQSRQQRTVSSFLGGIEANVVLAAVDLLCSFFVLIQVRYFFAGKANLAELGLTYSEYARRGFGELLAVAFLSLVLILSLQSSTEQQSARGQRLFLALSVLLVLLVGVILLSAFQRLGLYEQAYGFTRARLYAHTLMVWIGVALGAVLALELAKARRWVVHGLLLSAVGFSAHLVASSVDARVARANVARFASGANLDVAYLASLSSDAVPAMSHLFQDPRLPQSSREALGASLICWTWRHRNWDTPAPWQEFHLSRWRARRALAAVMPSLTGYQKEETSQGKTVCTPSGQTFSCTAACR